MNKSTPVWRIDSINWALIGRSKARREVVLIKENAAKGKAKIIIMSSVLYYLAPSKRYEEKKLIGIISKINNKEFIPACFLV